ncbi:MAG: cytochrome C oxidase assembly protein, partial [Bacteroidales bacterium]|nr:cytochrome C oxidase assembly protein [Bacteroidales bacterium]
IQAIAYEYRSKPANVLGKKTFDIFLLINGIFGPFLIVAAVATFFTGSQFSLDYMNHVKWANNWHGLEVLTDARNLALGLAVLFLVRSNGSMYIINSVKDEDLAMKANRKLMINAVVFLVFFLFFMVFILLSEGFAVDGDGKVTLEKYKYFKNFVQMPLVLVLFLAGVTGVLTGIIITIFRRSRMGIWYSGPGTILAVFSLFLIAGFNGTAFYPSAYDPGSSLTIRNASSSHFTLRTMMYVSFIIPFVFWYIWYAWKSISRKKISEESLDEESHLY